MVSGQLIVPIVENVALPAGVAGPEPLSFDVRCFLVPHSGGVVLVDTGMQPGAQPVQDALTGLGAGWDAVSDIVVTHAHPDHVGGLPAVVSRAPSATVWAGAGEPLAMATRSAAHGSRIQELRVIATPGHTAGHLCLLDEHRGILFAGDAIGTQDGRLTQGPPAFIADPERAAASLQRLADCRPDRLLCGHGAEIDNPAEALTTFVASTVEQRTGRSN